MSSRILIVDDEDSVRWVLDKGLRQAGYEVTTAKDGESAVRAFEITRLTPDDYEEREAAPTPVLGPGREGSWNGTGMHHVDPHSLPGGGWIACVDGRS